MTMNKTIKFLKEKGIYYTNSELAKRMIDNLDINYHRKFSIAELAVGEGHILKYIVSNYLEANRYEKPAHIKTFLENNIFAFDNRKEAINICKSELNRIVESYLGNLLDINWNIKKLDILDKKKIDFYYNKFDYIISNPPYIAKKNLKKNILEQLESESQFCKKFNYNFYYYFMEQGLNLWNKKKKMVFITPNSYLKSTSAKAMNDYLLKKRYFEKIIDFQNKLMFEDADTFTAISVFSPHNNSFSILDFDNNIISKKNYKDIEETDINPFYKYRLLPNKKTVNDYARVRTGIATLQDSAFIIKDSEIIKAEEKYLLIDKNKHIYKLEKKILRNGIRISRYKEKNFIIFPYNYNKGRYVLKSEEEFKKNYPCTYEYLDEILPKKYKSKYKYGWGRTQGIYDYEKIKIVVPRNTKLYNDPFYIVEKGFVISGIYLVPHDLNNICILKNYLNSEYVQTLLDTLSKTYVKGYKSLSSSLLKEIPILDEI